MIRIRTRFDKPFSQKIGIEKLYTESLPSEAELYFMSCPSCRARGGLHVHGYYSRNVVQFCGSRSADTILRVMRLKCKSCGHTHALLPDVIVPYLQYGLAFFLKVILASYDVPAQFIGQTVEIRYEPSDMSTAFVLYEGQHYSVRQTDRNENCRTKRSNGIELDYSKAGES